MHVSCKLSGDSDQELLTGAIMKCYRCKRVITIMKLTEGKVATESRQRSQAVQITPGI